MELKDLLGGKGANLAEMTSVLKLPVPPGFTISTDACRAYMAGGWPDGLSGEVAKARRRLERAMGKAIGDPADPLLVSVRSGAKFSMPGMMDTVLNLGLNDRSVEGLAAPDGRRALRLRLLPPVRLHVRPDRPRHPRRASSTSCSTRPRSWPGPRRTPACRPSCSTYLVDSYKGIVERHTGQPFPQDPDEQLRGRHRGGVPQLERRPGRRLPRARAHRARPRHRRQRPGDGLRQPRRPVGDRRRLHPRPGDRGQGRLRRLPRQRPGRGRGGRHPQHRAARRRSKDSFPKVHAELLAIFERLERHYRDMCDTEFTIEQGKLWMLQTRVGKRTGRAALRMAVDMTKEPAIGLSHGRGRLADHRGPPRLGAAPPVRRHRPQRAGQGPGRLARGGRRARLLHGRRRGRGRGSGASRSSWCAARPRPRTSTACWPPRGS